MGKKKFWQKFSFLQQFFFSKFLFEVKNFIPEIFFQWLFFGQIFFSLNNFSSKNLSAKISFGNYFYILSFLAIFSSLWNSFIGDGWNMLNRPRNLPLKFGQDRFSNSWDIQDMDIFRKNKYCLDKCHCYSWNIFKKVPGTYL